ncbi:MAG TPA: hypothetical protein VG226_01790 [Acidimicrobiales bacterium]|jgi:hypothetical protein|nr:hypothetical protein [Acidimicrobiales bacterium]
MLTGAQPGCGGSTVVVVVGGTVVVVVGGTVVVVVGGMVVVEDRPDGGAELPVGVVPEQAASTAIMPTTRAAAPSRADRDRVDPPLRFQKSITGDV